jgi:hypothetical protein
LLSKTFSFSRGQALLDGYVDLFESKLNLKFKLPINQEFLNRMGNYIKSLIKNWKSISGGSGRNELKSRQITLELNPDYFYLAVDNQDAIVELENKEIEIAILKHEQRQQLAEA